MTPQEKAEKLIYLLQDFLSAERYYHDPENEGYGRESYDNAREELEEFLTKHLFQKDPTP